VEDEKELPVKQVFSESTTIGVDVGINDFAAISTGDKVENPKYLKNSLKRLKVSKNELVENRMVLKTEKKKPNKNLLYFMRK
jgi:putative transposase